MRKRIAMLLSCLLVLMLFTACGKTDDPNKNESNNNTQNNTSPNSPTPSLPNNGMNNSGTGNGSTGNSTTTPEVPDNSSGKYPTFPNALADTNADVTLDDLIATLGMKGSELVDAMRDVSTVGDSVNGARTYRHKLLGQESDVSYSINDQETINKVTVKAGKDHAENWRKELNDVLGATAAQGETDTWDYSDSRVKITEDGDHILITIEKPNK